MNGITNTHLNQSIPRPDHVVVVIEENHSYNQIMGSHFAPYINSLAKQGAVLSNIYARDRPSQPNYLNLFAGSTLRVKSNKCPLTFPHDNLGSNLMKAGFTFGGYSEDLPSVGYMGCHNKKYARKHSPWVNFTNIPAECNLPFTHFPESDFDQLPTVSFVTPNLDHDMHDGSVYQGDLWLKDHFDRYIQWAKKNNSLFILTWDEGGWLNNHIPTIFVGEMVKPGITLERTLNHFHILRTLEDMYELPYVGRSGGLVYPITEIWQ